MGKVRCIALEGINGSGKTTIAKMLIESLSADYDVRMLKLPSYSVEHELPMQIYPFTEPSNEYSRHVRALLSTAQLMSKAAMMEDDGQKHLYIVDRYIASYAAYEGMNMGDKWVEDMLKIFNPPLPVLTVYIDIPVIVAMSRIVGPLDIYEQRDYTFWSALSGKIRESVSRYSDELLVVPGNMSESSIVDLICDSFLKIDGS